MAIRSLLVDLHHYASGYDLDRGSMKNLDRFLAEAGAVRKTTCACCSNAELAAAIVEFLDRLRDGKTEVTLNYLHRHFIIPRFGTPRYADSVRHHVRHCLRRNYKTGGPLDDR